MAHSSTFKVAFQERKINFFLPYSASIVSFDVIQMFLFFKSVYSCIKLFKSFSFASMSRQLAPVYSVLCKLYKCYCCKAEYYFLVISSFISKVNEFTSDFYLSVFMQIMKSHFPSSVPCDHIQQVCSFMSSSFTCWSLIFAIHVTKFICKAKTKYACLL